VDGTDSWLKLHRIHPSCFFVFLSEIKADIHIGSELLECDVLTAKQLKSAERLRENPQMSFALQVIHVYPAHAQCSDLKPQVLCLLRRHLADYFQCAETVPAHREDLPIPIK
jgi:hypothetical protein